MSDLQVGLLVLGLLLIAGVMSYNWWQARRWQKHAMASPFGNMTLGDASALTRAEGAAASADGALNRITAPIAARNANARMRA